MNIFQTIEQLCPTFSDNNNYWLVRTDGGNLYPVFREYGVISLGYPEITSSDIFGVSSIEEQKEKKLEKLVKSKYKEHARPGFIVSQILRFYTEIKTGDYVIIPDYLTNKLSIGQVESDKVEEKKLFKRDRKDNLIELEEYTKTKKVKWIKEVYKSHINPYLYRLFFSHQTIVNANDYSYLINSMIKDFFYDGQKYHLVFEISKRKVSAIDLLQSYSTVLEIANQYVERLEYEDSIEEIEISVNLNSPGKLELHGKRIAILFIVGTIVIALSGGGFKFKSTSLGIDSEITTPGLIKNINEFLNSQIDRNSKEQLISKIDSLKITDPNDIIKIMNEINKKNQND